MTWAELVEEETGYKPFTTFWQDFTIADAFGETAVQDTYNKERREWIVIDDDVHFMYQYRNWD